MHQAVKQRSSIARQEQGLQEEGYQKRGTKAWPRIYNPKKMVKTKNYN